MNITQKLEKYVGRRYKRLEDIINDLKTLGYQTPTVGEDSSPIPGLDHQLICSLDPDLTHSKGKYMDFTFYYLKDRDNNYYITEVNPWGIF